MNAVENRSSMDRRSKRESTNRIRVPAKLRKKMNVLAADLRKQSTRSEETLWRTLRNRQLQGRKFRRQVAIGGYVVDFYCAEERLVIEIDGPIHALQQEADTWRQEALEALNLRFLRLTASQVEHDLPSVIQLIEAHFQSTPQLLTTPQPNAE